MRQLLLSIGLLASVHLSSAQDSTWVTPDLVVVKLSGHAYLHTSWFKNPSFGRFPCNGLVLVSDGEAMLFDTPMTDSSTVALLHYIEHDLHARLTAFVPNHFHEDCTEGMDQFPPGKITTYAHQQTLDSLPQATKQQAPPVPFSETLNISLRDLNIHLAYHGPAHAPDNIVAWIPSEKLLFAGCMCKSANAQSLGFTGHANLAQWPITIKKVLDAYPNAQRVIPGHGNMGGPELLQHTLELLQH